MNIEEQLKTFDLTKSEAKVYVRLLEQGISSPPQIAKATGIARTNCYNILEKLQNAGLIEEHQKGKRKAYIASDPESLLRSVQKKKEAVERLIPDLRALYTVQKNKPKIKFYDGFDQVKEIYWMTTQTESLKAIGSTKQIAEKDPQFFLAYEKKLKANNVMLQDLITSESKKLGSEETKNILKGFYDFFVLPDKYKDFPTDILIWDDNIALIALADPVFGTVITSSYLAKTFHYIFEMLWEYTSKK